VRGLQVARLDRVVYGDDLSRHDVRGSGLDPGRAGDKEDRIRLSQPMKVTHTNDVLYATASGRCQSCAAGAKSRVDPEVAERLGAAG
jgi:hypothetical protein